MGSQWGGGAERPLAHVALNSHRWCCFGSRERAFPWLGLNRCDGVTRELSINAGFVVAILV